MNNQNNQNQKPKPSYQNQFEAPKEAPSNKPQEPADIKRELGQIGGEFKQSFTHDFAEKTVTGVLMGLIGQEYTQHHTNPQAKEQDDHYWKNRAINAEKMNSEQMALHQQKEVETNRRISQITQELQAMTQSMGTFAKEAEKVAFQAQSYETADVYTENFFMQLLSFITKLRARINSANKWLQASNARASKKGQGHPFVKGNRMQVDAYMSGERASAFGG